MSPLQSQPAAVEEPRDRIYYERVQALQSGTIFSRSYSRDLRNITFES